MIYNHEEMEKKNEKNELPNLYQFIVDTVNPEKIFCLVDQIGKSRETGYADVMITMPDMPVKASLEIQIAMKLASLNYHNLAATICQTEYMDKMIEEGNIYFNVAINDESLIYNKGAWKKPVMDNGLKSAEKAKAYQIFYSGLRKTHAFYALAKTHQENNFALSAFLLHQATELCLHTLMKALIGRGKHTHHLQELLLYSFRYNKDLPLILKGGCEEDERLLNLLNDAYNDYRYTDDFIIAEKDLKILLGKVDKLQEATEQTFLDWIKRYEML